jgi:5-methylcytosine-specific restriction endonuclease McrA
MTPTQAEKDRIAFLRREARKDRQEIFRRDGYMCIFCHGIRNLQDHHILALENGGDNRHEWRCTLDPRCHHFFDSIELPPTPQIRKYVTIEMQITAQKRLLDLVQENIKKERERASHL